ILYGVGGGLALIINLSLAYIFTEKLKIFYLGSAILSYIISLIFNFLFQSFITFKTKQELFFQRFFWFFYCSNNRS
ncbi:MAG: GtrA family protein, partial [Candidatus Aenigmatarchaeota archaeon]